MPLELSQEDVVMRVDGDVLEIFRTGAGSERVRLSWLAVQVQPSFKGHLVIRIRCTSDDAPLYEVVQKAKILTGTVAELSIRIEDEPFYRQFFTQVAQLCSRPVMP
jgi:hypothetical protein